MRLALAGLAALAIALAPTAQATPQDDAYLQALAAAGITGDPGQLIAWGHQACDAYGTPGMVGHFLQLESAGYSVGQVSTITAAGIKAYCPEKIAGSPLAGPARARVKTGIGERHILDGTEILVRYSPGAETPQVRILPGAQAPPQVRPYF